MERRPILKVNINCLRILHTVRQETLQSSERDMRYQYAHNTMNYSESNILVSGQSNVRTQASVLTSEPEQEQFSSVHSDRNEKANSLKTVNLTSDDKLTDKNDNELTDTSDDKITEKNYKYNHDENHDSVLSDSSTVAGSIQNFSLDEDECSEPKIIQMSEVTSTKPVKDNAEYSPTLSQENHLVTTEASLLEARRCLQYSPALFQENHLDTTEASLFEVKTSLRKPKIIADEILSRKVFVCCPSDTQNINANVDMTNEINSKFLGFKSNERDETFKYNFHFSLLQSEDENRNLTSSTEDLLSFSPEAAKDSTLVNETRDVTVGVEGNTNNLLNTSTSSGQSEDFLGFSPKTAKDSTLVNETIDVTVGVEENISNSLNTSISSGQSEDFLGFSPKTALNSTLVNETKDVTVGVEGNISNSLNTFISSGQSEDFLRFPREGSLENLSNFQDLIENVESDPITYKFANIIRDTSNCVRSESPSYSYLRNNLPDQVEPLLTVVSPRNYIKSSILSPISNLKSSGYLDLIPVIQKLTTLDIEEYNKLQRRLQSKRYQLIRKAKLKLKTKSQEKKTKFKAPKSAWASPKLTRASKKIEKVSTDHFNHRVKTRRMIRESKRREREQEIALLRRTDSCHKTRTFAKVSNNSLKVEETPKADPHILQSRRLNFTYYENGQSNGTKSVVTPLPDGVMLKELRVNLTPVTISSFMENFENKKQISNSIFDSSLVPETNTNFSNEFEEYEHLKYHNESIKDSTDVSQFTAESTFEEKRSDSDIDSHKKAIIVRRSERIRKSALKRKSYLTMSSDEILKNQSQVRKLSKKVTFSAQVTVYHYQKNK